MGNLVSQDVEGNYKKFCKELLENDPKNKSGCLHWATPPFQMEQLSHFIECLEKNNCLKRLVLRDLDNLPDNPSLAKAIQQHTALQCLAFSGRLPKKGFEVYADAFLQSASLTELEVENSIIPANTIDGIITVLGQQDKASNQMTSLTIKGCQVIEFDLTRLARTLEWTKVSASLETLEITLKPPIQATEAAKSLAKFFQAQDSVLKDLHLSGFLVDSIPILLTGLQGHSSLERFKFNGKIVDDSSISKLLAEATKLTILDLTGCGISSAGGTNLANALETTKCTSIRELYLSENSLSDDGTIALSKALTSDSLSGLQVLDLRWNQIGTTGNVAMAKALQANKLSLLRLHLGEESARNSQPFGEEDVKALSAMLQVNTTLEELYMGDASFHDEGLDKLLEALAQNTSLKQWHVACSTTSSLQSIFAKLSELNLKKIHIRANNEVAFDEASGRAMLEMLKENKSLVEFSMEGLKERSGSVWKAIEPQIKSILKERQGENGSNGLKRQLDPPNDESDQAKRAKSDEEGRDN